MNSQFRAGNSGGARISDSVGMGSDAFDARLGMLVPNAVRARAANSVADMLRKPGTMNVSSRPSLPAGQGAGNKVNEQGWKINGGDDGVAAEERLALARQAKEGPHEDDDAKPAQKRNIFDSLVIYVNGSTLPLVSDHKLKHLLSEHGARISLHLGRRQVTHVILGKPAGPNGGAGGGLAGGKLEKEIRRVGGCGIKFVGVEW